MAMNGIGSYASKMRLTGLSGSGLDTESIVKQLMQVEKIPLNRLGQRIQQTEWKRDAYREITSSLQGFKSDFFDVLKPANNMLSTATYKKFTSSVLENGTASTVVSATGTSDATAGTHKIIVNKMATASYAVGTPATRPLAGDAANPLDDASIAALNGKTFRLTVDGVTKDIKIGASTSATFAGDLQGLISNAFGKTPDNQDKVKVDFTGGILSFASNVPTVNRITLNAADTTNTLSSMGFKSGDSNRLSTGFTLGQLADKFATPLAFGTGTADVTSAKGISTTGLKGKSFFMTVDGVTKSYTFTSDPASVDDMAAALNTWANSSDGFGADSINITSSATTDGGTGLSFARNKAGYITLNSGPGDNDALKQMNILAGSETTGQLKFTINSKEFTFKASQSLGSMLSTINGDAAAKVNLTYDENSDTFKITAKQLGPGNNIEISQGALGGNFFAGASNISTGNPVLPANMGHDAEVQIDGVDLVRSSNSLTVNGVNYTILRENPGVTQNVSINADVDSVYNNIKNFVDKYNEVIAKLNSKLSEDYNRDYLPLTDDQKAGMSEADIQKWETRAKTGLLRNDSIIKSAVDNMRKALSDSVAGVNGNLASIGITTGTYEEKGKLYIDESKLKAAIQKDPDSVMNLFAKKSSIDYTQYGQRSQRFAEEGFAQRLSDVLQDNIRTSRDTNGNKGSLLEKAGMVGDASEFKNVLYDEIYDDAKKLTRLSDKLADKENAYYAKFTAMESALQKMQSQKTWLSQQLGGA